MGLVCQNEEEIMCVTLWVEEKHEKKIEKKGQETKKKDCVSYATIKNTQKESYKFD